jgi:hypothetical protein
MSIVNSNVGTCTSQYISKTSKWNFLQWKFIAMQIIIHFNIFGVIMQNFTNEYWNVHQDIGIEGQ